MRKICAIAFTVMIFVGASEGQALIPKSGNAFFGYSYSQGQVVKISRIGVNMNGWEGTLEGKFLPWLGGVADFDWHYGGVTTSGCVGTGCTPVQFRLNGSRHNILFGPRASVTLGKYTPFVHFLVGFTHQTDSGGGTSHSDLVFSNGAGGGLDYKLIDGVVWRVQGDWIHAHLFGIGSSDFRFSTGIGFRF